MGGDVAVAAARKTRPVAKDAEIVAIDQESPETAIYNKIHRAIAERGDQGRKHAPESRLAHEVRKMP